MSMHDIEEFAEIAVSFIGECALSAAEKIALIHNIYRFHDGWDTGFTRLRVYDTLIATGYWHAFTPSEHPDYARYRDFFDSPDKMRETFIHENPLDTASPVTCYRVDSVTVAGRRRPVNKLCCQAGSPLWKRLTGKDDPPDWGAQETMLRLAELAFSARNNRLPAMIFMMVFYTLGETTDRTIFEKLKAVFAVEEIYPLLPLRGDEFDDDTDEPDLADEWAAGFMAWRRRQEKPGPSASESAGKTTKEKDCALPIRATDKQHLEMLQSPEPQPYTLLAIVKSLHAQYPKYNRDGNSATLKFWKLMRDSDICLRLIDEQIALGSDVALVLDHIDRASSLYEQDIGRYADYLNGIDAGNADILEKISSIRVNARYRKRGLDNPGSRYLKYLDVSGLTGAALAALGDSEDGAHYIDVICRYLDHDDIEVVRHVVMALAASAFRTPSADYRPVLPKLHKVWKDQRENWVIRARIRDFLERIKLPVSYFSDLEMNSFEAAIAEKDVEKAMDAYRNRGSDKDNILARHVGPDFLKSLPEDKTGKYLALDENAIDNPYMADFVRLLRIVESGKDNSAFLLRRATELLDEGKTDMAQVMIDNGLALAPENDMLRLYRAAMPFYRASQAVLSRDRDTSAITEQIPVAEELAAKETFPHRDFASYILSMLLYYAGNRKAAEKVMRKAAELNPAYQQYYQHFFTGGNTTR